MFRLAHFSDPHLGPLPAVALRDLASKRLLGYLNWRRKRGSEFRPEVLEALVADMRQQRPDHIVVTGDLVNLGLHAEFVGASRWLATLGSHKDVTVIPGNHEAYARGSVESYSHTWRSHMQADEAVGDGITFPFVRRRGPVALIGVSTAVATAPFMATGRIGADQSAALGEILEALAGEGLFRVVLIHHPPTRDSTLWHRRLIDAELARDPIASAGAELVVHGHNHATSIGEIAGPRGPVPVVGAPTPSKAHGAYLLFDIDGAPGRFTCTMTERGVRVPGGEVRTISTRTLAG